MRVCAVDDVPCEDGAARGLEGVFGAGFVDACYGGAGFDVEVGGEGLA